MQEAQASGGWPDAPLSEEMKDNPATWSSDQPHRVPTRTALAAIHRSAARLNDTRAILRRSLQAVARGRAGAAADDLTMGFLDLLTKAVKPGAVVTSIQETSLGSQFASLRDPLG